MLKVTPQLSTPIIYILFAILCLISYSNSLNNAFLMDDHALILDNRELGDISHLQLNPFSKSSSTADGSNYVYFRPITHIADYLSYVLFEKEAVGYHAMNLLLFFFSSIVLFKFLSKTISESKITLLTCIFYITHPINGVLINYTSTTGYILLIIFSILSLSFYLEYLEEHNTFDLIFSLTFFFFSILCHETAITLPLYLGGVLFFARNRSVKTVILNLIPFFVIVAGYLLFRMFYASLKAGVIDQISTFDLSLSEYVIMYSQLIFFYLKNLIALQDIVLIYSSPVIQYPLVIGYIKGIVFLTIIIFMFFKWRKDTKSLALTWILIGLAPVTLACFSRPSMGMIISPHWLLLSSIGYCLLLATLFNKLLILNQKKLYFIVVLFMTIAFSYVSRQYNKLWSNEIQYCRYMITLSPHIPLTKFWLANAYFANGQYDLSKMFFKATIMGVENDWKGYSNIGVIEGLQGNKELEIKYYYKALALKPNSIDILNNIAAVYMEKKDFAEAEKILNQILKIEPNFIEAERNLKLLRSKHYVN